MRLRIAAAVVFAGLLAATPARAEIPAGNLLSNPGAEQAPGATDDTNVLPPPGWQVSGAFTAVQYGTPAFPTQQDSAKLGAGASFFAGGPDSADSTATQTVDVSRAAAEIDAGAVSASLSGLLGGYSSQLDSVSVVATFLNSSRGALGTLQIGPVTAADRQDVTTLLARAASARVPAGTRAIAVKIDAVRTDGAYNDGYSDRISLALVAAVAGKSVIAAPVSGKVLVKKPGATGFVALDAAQGIPLGSTVDTRHGVVQITAKSGQSAKFYDGIFKITQVGSVTQLQLVEALDCGAATAKKPRTRKLWGDGSGSFRTRGQYSSATVRGTRWLVQDTCTTTLTRVVKGVVTVRDLVKDRTVIVRAGKRYTARRKGR